jgi:ParB-like chromosome segregation protein Spo0J
MARSLSRYGQISPVVVCEREGVYELIDGFKRFSAARQLKPIPKLSCRLIEVDERGAKAAIYGLNRVGGRTRELEEAWIVHALVREDGLSQVEVAELLGRHKSWVCRRLALIEKLVPEAREKLRLGLLCPSAARQLIRLPVGNQKELLPVIRREALSVEELSRVVDVLLRSSDRSQQAYVLQQPREALAQDEHAPLPAQDPRLSAAANVVFKRLGSLNAQMSRMENWLQHYGRAELTPRDQTLLGPHFDKLSHQATRLAALCQDVLSEMEWSA